MDRASKSLAPIKQKNGKIENNSGNPKQKPNDFMKFLKKNFSLSFPEHNRDVGIEEQVFGRNICHQRHFIEVVFGRNTSFKSSNIGIVTAIIKAHGKFCIQTG